MPKLKQVLGPVELKASRPGKASRFVLNRMIKAAARKTIAGRERVSGHPERGRFTKKDVEEVIERAWRNFDQLAQGIPFEQTLGARINVILSALTISVYRALLSMGVEEEYATSLMADAIWVVYRRWGEIARWLSLLRARNPFEQLSASIRLFLRFPFNVPAYTREDLKSDDAVAFNVTRCPVADYFRFQGLSEVCVITWCNQDYALAEMWGAYLVRNATIAAGATRCSFRFKQLSYR